MASHAVDSETGNYRNFRVNKEVSQTNKPRFIPWAHIFGFASVCENKGEIRLIQIHFKELPACFIAPLPQCVYDSLSWIFEPERLHKLLIKVKDLPPQRPLPLNQDNHTNCAPLFAKHIHCISNTSLLSVEKEDSRIELRSRVVLFTSPVHNGNSAGASTLCCLFALDLRSFSAAAAAQTAIMREALRRNQREKVWLMGPLWQSNPHCFPQNSNSVSSLSAACTRASRQVFNYPHWVHAAQPHIQFTRIQQTKEEPEAGMRPRKWSRTWPFSDWCCDNGRGGFSTENQFIKVNSSICFFSWGVRWEPQRLVVATWQIISLTSCAENSWTDGRRARTLSDIPHAAHKLLLLETEGMNRGWSWSETLGAVRLRAKRTKWCLHAMPVTPVTVYIVIKKTHSEED